MTKFTFLGLRPLRRTAMILGLIWNLGSSASALAAADFVVPKLFETTE